MASAAEQLAANLNFGAFAKATELKKRIWFTLGALVSLAEHRLAEWLDAAVDEVDPVVLSDVLPVLDVLDRVYLAQSGR